MHAQQKYRTSKLAQGRVVRQEPAHDQAAKFDGVDELICPSSGRTCLQAFALKDPNSCTRSEEWSPRARWSQLHELLVN